MKIFFLLIFLNAHVLAVAPKLTSTKKLNYKSPHYEPVDDQAFIINSGPLKNKTMFFASLKQGEAGGKVPKFILTEGDKVISEVNLPTIEEGWNIVSVKAVGVTHSPESEGFWVLSIITFEPLSSRSEDYWDQPLVLSVSKDGKLNVMAETNERLSTAKEKIKTIKDLKNFLQLLPK